MERMEGGGGGDTGESMFTLVEKLMQALCCVATMATFLRVIFEQVMHNNEIKVLVQGILIDVYTKYQPSNTLVGICCVATMATLFLSVIFEQVMRL